MRRRAPSRGAGCARFSRAESRPLLSVLLCRWMAWPKQIEPLLVPLARTYGWHVFDAHEVVAAAARQVRRVQGWSTAGGGPRCRICRQRPCRRVLWGRGFAPQRAQGLQASWDALHLFPFVYQELNDLMLNALCGAAH